ncbi:MAG: TetR/AcrR family transcriptional regulator [Planctomycetes bacterium]|nr:TetR/AcrR family transcriptional regulator [Planctomycetota bacterium]
MKTADKRGEILAVALELMAEKGFHGVPMSLIAERANVATGTIYLYFPGKDALIEEVYRELESRIRAFLQKNHVAGTPLRERFLSLMRGLLQYLIANPLEFRYVEQYYNSPYGISLRRDRISELRDGTSAKSDEPDMLADLLQEGISDHMVKDLPVIVLFSLAVAPLVFLARDHILGFVALDEALIERATEACWDAIRP